ncbi:hypothetical protein ACT3UD_10195 [Glutamicibacter sp. 287]|uniref:hypothetical protein n=1 Tax=unclassified Glutamicibacter TaxID=2627139 RepID=UPI001143AE28|nr:hypothetical protein [Glutamicibacter sp. BW80]
MSVKNEPPALPNLREAGGIPAAWLDSMRTMLSEELRHLMLGTSVAGLERAPDLGIAQHGSLGDYRSAHGLSTRRFERLAERLVDSR